MVKKISATLRFKKIKDRIVLQHSDETLLSGTTVEQASSALIEQLKNQDAGHIKGGIESGKTRRKRRDKFQKNNQYQSAVDHFAKKFPQLTITAIRDKAAKHIGVTRRTLENYTKDPRK